jgi:hypothetical protein
MDLFVHIVQLSVALDLRAFLVAVTGPGNKLVMR